MIYGSVLFQPLPPHRSPTKMFARNTLALGFGGQSWALQKALIILNTRTKYQSDHITPCESMVRPVQASCTPHPPSKTLRRNTLALRISTRSWAQTVFMYCLKHSGEFLVGASDPRRSMPIPVHHAPSSLAITPLQDGCNFCGTSSIVGISR